VCCELRNNLLVRQLGKLGDRFSYRLLECLRIRERPGIGRAIVRGPEVGIPVPLALQVRVERGPAVVVLLGVRHAADRLLLV
jgi:hypothetical protein